MLQQQLQQIGIKTKITLLEAGQRVEKVESWQDPKTAPVRLYYVGWSTSTGEADWALRPLLYGESWPPQPLQHRVLQERQGRRRHQERAADDRHGGEGEALQGRAGDDLERRAVGAAGHRALLSANNKKLSGVYVIPDASFNFTEIDLK